MFQAKGSSGHVKQSFDGTSFSLTLYLLCSRRGPMFTLDAYAYLEVFSHSVWYPFLDHCRRKVSHRCCVSLVVIYFPQNNWVILGIPSFRQSQRTLSYTGKINPKDDLFLKGRSEYYKIRKIMWIFLLKNVQFSITPQTKHTLITGNHFWMLLFTPRKSPATPHFEGQSSRLAHAIFVGSGASKKLRTFPVFPDIPWRNMCFVEKKLRNVHRSLVDGFRLLPTLRKKYVSTLVSWNFIRSCRLFPILGQV